MKRLLLALLLVALAALPARADSAEQVASALRSSSVYQAPGLDLVDVGTLTAELSGSDPRVVVAVLDATAAASAEQAKKQAIAIGNAIGDDDVVVLVITANRQLGAAHGSRAADRGANAAKALAAELSAFKGKEFTKDNLTVFATSFAEDIANQVGRPAAGVSNGDHPVDTGGGSGGAWLLAIVVVLGAAAAALAVRSSQQRRRRTADQPVGATDESLLGSLLPGGFGGQDDPEAGPRTDSAGDE